MHPNREGASDGPEMDEDVVHGQLNDGMVATKDLYSWHLVPFLVVPLPL